MCLNQAMDVRHRASVEPPDGWAATRILLGQLRDLGYQVVEYRILGRSILVITG